MNRRTTLGALGARPIDHDTPEGPSTYVQLYQSSRPRRSLAARLGPAAVAALAAAVLSWEAHRRHD